MRSVVPGRLYGRDQPVLGCSACSLASASFATRRRSNGFATVRAVSGDDATIGLSLPGEAIQQPGFHEIKALAEQINRAGGGYHVLRPLAGIEVIGQYDMYPYLRAFHIPEDLSGHTVLDVGTASGFFAMECARRGAAEVTAVDVVQWDEGHWAIAEQMGWNIRQVQCDIYDLDPSIGEFDLVICGSLLLHLPDPVGAIRRLRSVCRGRAVLSTSRPRYETADATCEFVGEKREGGEYWAYWNIGPEALRRMLLAAGFADVEHLDEFTLTTTADSTQQWSIPHAVAHGVVA